MTANREQLLRAATIARPALASAPYIPALTHLRFDREGVTAFDDVSAINVFVDDHGLECCVPGDLFIRALTGFSAKDVAVAPGKDGSVVLRSGKGRISLPTLPLDDHPFLWKSVEGRADYSFEVTGDVLDGVERCLISVGSDPHHPAQMGLTIGMQDGTHCAVLYSTDDATITRYVTDTKIELPAEAPVLLPTFFCEQALALSKAFPKSRLHAHLLGGAVKLSVTDGGEEVAMLYTRLLFDVDPLDFDELFRKSLGDVDYARMLEIPPGWDETLSRCLLVTSEEVVKTATLEIDKGGELTVRASSNLGEVDEVLTVRDGRQANRVRVDPALLRRAAPFASSMYFANKAFVLASADGRMTHVLAYYPNDPRTNQD